MIRLTHFGGVALPTANENTSGDYVIANSLLPLQQGAFDLYGQGLVFRPMTIVKRFEMIGASIDTDWITLMQALGAGRRVLKGVLRDGSTYWQTFAKTSAIRQTRAPGTHVYQPVEVSWIVDYPFWLATADEPTYFDNGAVLDGGLYFDAGNKTAITVDSISETATITNSGGVAIPRGRITITPGAGASLTNIWITNVTTNQQIGYQGTLIAGDKLEIDLLTRTARLNYLTDAYASMVIPSNQVEWLRLNVGANAITVVCDAVTNSTTLNWYWSKHYLI